MSTRIKFNVKHVILARHNFSDILATCTPKLSGLSRLVVPKAIPLSRSDCDYYKQAYVRRPTFNDAQAVLPQALQHLSLKRVSSNKQVTSKWVDDVQTGPICSPSCWLPWESSYTFFYDFKNPKCPVKPKYLPYPCPPMLKSNPYKEPIKSDPFTDSTSCSLKTVALNMCRFYSGNPCQRRRRRRRRRNAKACKCEPCLPKEPECRPVPKERKKKKQCLRRGCIPILKIQPKKADPCGVPKSAPCPKPPKRKCPKPPKCPKPM